MNHVEVDVISLQSGKALVDTSADRVGVDATVDFGCDEEAAATSLQGSPENAFREPVHVHRGGIEEVDPAVERRAQNGIGLSFVATVTEHHGTYAHLG